MKRGVIAAFALVGAAAVWPAPLPRPYAIDHYDVRLHPDFIQQRLVGEVVIRLHSTIGRLDSIDLDAADSITVETVLAGAVPQRFERSSGTLQILFARPAVRGETVPLTIRYEAGPGRGLKFFPDQIFSSYFTDEWMVCNFRPDGRATLNLWIEAPAGMKVAASGSGGSPWKIESPTPPFLYGFAIGRFTESSAPGLRVLGTKAIAGYGGAVLNATADAIRFLAEKTGRPRTRLYTQVFTRGNPEQEDVDLTLLPEAYGVKQAEDPTGAWLLAHELAHQWFAVGIQCEDWSDFWLNEGLATFLADAYLEHRFGRERYEKEIAQSRANYEKLVHDGKDRPLSFHGWTTTEEASGRLPYDKGAYVLDLLRREMGDGDFWRGLQKYTRDHWNGAVTSPDFQKSMQSATSTDLGAFFDRWVYRPKS